MPSSDRDQPSAELRINSADDLKSHIQHVVSIIQQVKALKMPTVEIIVANDSLHDEAIKSLGPLLPFKCYWKRQSPLGTNVFVPVPHYRINLPPQPGMAKLQAAQKPAKAKK